MVNIHSHKPSESNNTTVVNVLMNSQVDDHNLPCFSAGIHPWYLTNLEEQKTKLQNFNVKKNCLAIGECGLDKVCASNLKLQHEIFTYQCTLARQFNKPMIIHSVKAHFDTLAVLKANGIKKAIFHGFNNRYTILEKIIQEGYSVSFGEALLNERSQAAALLKLVPVDKFFLETDDSTEPIEKIYAKAAEICGIEKTNLVAQQEINFKNFTEQ